MSLTSSSSAVVGARPACSACRRKSRAIQALIMDAVVLVCSGCSEVRIAPDRRSITAQPFQGPAGGGVLLVVDTDFEMVVVGVGAVVTAVDGATGMAGAAACGRPDSPQPAMASTANPAT